MQDGTLKSTDINLKTVKASEAIKLIGQNIIGQRLFFKLDGNRYYALTEYTIDKLSKGLIDENRVSGSGGVSPSDAELQSITTYSSTVTLQTLQEKIKEEREDDMASHPTGNKRFK